MRRPRAIEVLTSSDLFGTGAPFLFYFRQGPRDDTEMHARFFLASSGNRVKRLARRPSSRGKGFYLHPGARNRHRDRNRHSIVGEE